MKHSVAKEVFEKLDRDPYAKQAIKLGIANYSSIARRLKIKGATFHAVKAAVRRYAEQMKYFRYEEELKQIFSKTKITLRSNIAVLFLVSYDPLVILQKIPKDIGDMREAFSFISSPNGITIILDQNRLRIMKKKLKRYLIAELENMYEIILTSPFEKIDKTPGFVAFITELLAREGINIREYYSCYTDTVLVLDKKDAIRAYELLDRVMANNKEERNLGGDGR